MPSLRALLPLFTPIVAAWAGWQRSHVLRVGDPLPQATQEVAAAVGVAQPERIRVRVVRRIPIPGGRVVEWLADRFGLPGPDVDGLTLGHAIFIRRGAWSTQLLAHECRHVQQFEMAGSLRAFLGAYLAQVARHGYRDAPFEADARAAARRWSRER